MKKNIIVILCDQLRWDFLSCYGFKGCETKNIDRLASMGICFDHATTASPVCAPARASMMTGRYVSDHQVWTNDTPFRTGVSYMPQEMAELGYHTGCFGKLHHFPARDTKGFQVSYQMEEGRLKEKDDYLIWLKSKHPEVEKMYSCENGSFDYIEEEYYEHWITSHALTFLNENKDVPYLAWISYQGPHGPMDPPKEIENPLKDQIPLPKRPEFVPDVEVPKYRRSRDMTKNPLEYREKYVDMILEIDQQIGRILDWLTANHQLENTTIIFSADHGDLCMDYDMAQKGPFPYSAQLEIPLILADSSLKEKNIHSDMLVSNLDIPATVLHSAGCSPFFASSRSIFAMLKDEKLQRKHLYSEFCDSVRILCDQQFKFAYYPFAKEMILIRHEDETHNLWKEAGYEEKIIDYMAEIIDEMIGAKGVQIEAQDLTPKVQKGLEEIVPDYKDTIPLVYPIAHEWQRESLRKDGLDADYNEFIRERKVLRSYHCYWED